MVITSDDKFDALWVSHSSSSDFLNCPRKYYLSNVYKDPDTGNKIGLINPALILGQVVHNTIEALSTLPVDKRFNQGLTDRFEEQWNDTTGIDEVFADEEEREEFKNKGLKMVKRVEENPGPLQNKAVKINKESGDIPQYWLSREDEIILCGMVDWLEYLGKEDGVRVIDFKTGKHREDSDSLQLPIYNLLANNCQSHDVSRASYWYLRYDDEPSDVELPDVEESRQRVLEVAHKMKEAREKENFSCPRGGCMHCEPFERIIDGEGEYVGQGGFGTDLYVLRTD